MTAERNSDTRIFELIDARDEEKDPLKEDFVRSFIESAESSYQEHIADISRDPDYLRGILLPYIESGKSQTETAAEYPIMVSENFINDAGSYIAQLDFDSFIALFDYSKTMLITGSAAQYTLRDPKENESLLLTSKIYPDLSQAEREKAMSMDLERYRVQNQLLTEDPTGFLLVDEMAKRYSDNPSQSRIPPRYLTSDLNESPQILEKGALHGAEFYKMAYRAITPFYNEQ